MRLRCWLYWAAEAKDALSLLGYKQLPLLQFWELVGFIPLRKNSCLSRQNQPDSHVSNINSHHVRMTPLRDG